MYQITQEQVELFAIFYVSPRIVSVERMTELVPAIAKECICMQRVPHQLLVDLEVN